MFLECCQEFKNWKLKAFNISCQFFAYKVFDKNLRGLTDINQKEYMLKKTVYVTNNLRIMNEHRLTILS